MDNLESIDKYLVSEIDGMESTPSDQVWNSIEAKLQAGKAARKIRSRNWKIASVSTLAIATVAVITYSTLSPEKRSNNIVTSNPVITAPVQNTTIAASEDQPIITSKPTENVTPASKHNSSLNETVPSEKLVRRRSEDKKDIIDLAPTKQETPLVTSAASTTVNETKKDNSDKGIIMLPYFAPGYAGAGNTQNDKATAPPPSVSTKIDPASENTTKVEPKENTIYMPNAFTPNGDGLNDVFIPQTAETPGEYKLSIFDRSGNLVFFSDDIQKGWDGRINKNGLEDVKEDVYIWRIEMKTAKGEKRHLMGSVTLLK